MSTLVEGESTGAKQNGVTVILNSQHLNNQHIFTHSSVGG
jgi:hypothetical protein